MGKTYILTTAGRQYLRQFDTAIRKKPVRALAELITNSDDSYRRLEAEGNDVTGRILVELDRRRDKRTIAVIDDGEGLTDEEMGFKFAEYGASTSGMKESQNVRGYFGKGIKDVLFGMEKGRVKSIKDGILYTAEFRWGRDKKPEIRVNKSRKRVTDATRDALGIPGNGTRVEFEIPGEGSVPRHETLRTRLSSFYMLRTINSSPDRRVVLRTINASGPNYEDEVIYSSPVGVLLLD